MKLLHLRTLQATVSFTFLFARTLQSSSEMVITHNEMEIDVLPLHRKRKD